MKIGSVLRESRINSKMTVEQVSKVLTEQGYKASQKTVYSWENGNSRPDIEILMKLCDLYGIKDILRTFGYDGYKEDGSIQLNMKEIEHIEKFRSLDDFGKEHISYELDREAARVRELNNMKERIQELENEPSSTPTQIRAISYYQRLASAGTGQIVFDGVPVDKIEIPDIPEYKRVSYAIGVNGNSMEPLYHDGDILLIEPTCKVDVGEIGIFIIGDESYVKKLGKGKLISLNAGYGDIPLTEYSKCMGRVIDKISKYPELSDEDADALREGMIAALAQQKKA